MEKQDQETPSREWILLMVFGGHTSSSFQIEDFIETQLYKLHVILRPRALREVEVSMENIGQ